jgi:hypothetical protein
MDKFGFRPFSDLNQKRLACSGRNKSQLLHQLIRGARFDEGAVGTKNG